MKKIAILLLSIIIAFALWQFYDLSSYLSSTIAWRKENQKIELNAKKRDKWFAELDSISLFVFKKDYKKSLELIDNFYRTDTNRFDLLLKYACINLCLQNETEAMKAIDILKYKISYKLGPEIVINNPEIMYYALVSESIILDKSIDSLLTKYSLTRQKEWILNDLDSIITKQIYDIK